jgi:hypothetical protein
MHNVRSGFIPLDSLLKFKFPLKPLRYPTYEDISFIYNMETLCKHISVHGTQLLTFKILVRDPYILPFLIIFPLIYFIQIPSEHILRIALRNLSESLLAY